MKAVPNFKVPIKLLTLAAWLVVPAGRPLAQESVLRPDVSTNAVDEADCKRQLNRIFGAIQEYRKEHGGQPPDRLLDLTPDYIHDRKVLVCPVVQKRGGLRTWKQFVDLSSDPYTSYSFEFPPVLADHYRFYWRGLPKKTVREIRERQAEMYGEMVPIVRCHNHFPWLNLSVEGPIYPSDNVCWELKFFESETFPQRPALLFPSPAAPRQLNAADFPPRDPGADPRLLNLNASYNAKLTDSWHGFPGNDLAALPTGIREFDGVLFDVRGVIQLEGTELAASFPRQVTGIEVRQKCSRIHFLHALSFVSPNKQQASYRMYYADPVHQVEEFAVINGQHIADWWYDPRLPLTPPSDAPIAWQGLNEAAKAYNTSLRLYHAVWENPHKDAQIETITFDALPKQRVSGPFVVAITLE